MSGGPVALFKGDGSAILPFGVISHDPEGETDKYDRCAPGNLTVAVLPVSVSRLLDGRPLMEFGFRDPVIVRNSNIKQLERRITDHSLPPRQISSKNRL